VGPGRLPRRALIGLARSKKFYYAGLVVSGAFPPRPLSVVPVAIHLLLNEG
jgi:hypothetical protein